MGTMSKGTVLTIPNKHIPECGDPPDLDASQFSYCSYFENDYGEQLCIVFDGETAWLYHGDLGWLQRHKVEHGQVPGIILSQEELQWLQLCWHQIELRLAWLQQKQK